MELESHAFDWLPDELLHHLVGFLDTPSSFFAFALACRRTAAVAHLHQMDKQRAFLRIIDIPPRNCYEALPNGVKHGTEWIRSEEGVNLKQCTYVHGALHGPAQYWHHAINMYERLHYRNGKLDGFYRVYDHASSLLKRSHWRNGKKDGCYEIFHKDGHLLTREWYRDDLLHGPSEEFGYSTDPVPRRIPLRRTEYRDGQKHGQEIMWDLVNGHIVSVGHFYHGKKDGVARDYDSGILVQETHWRDGNLEGELTQWRCSGELSRTGNYQRNQAHGMWITWRLDGSPMIKKQYDHGVLLRTE
jgi:antitoxin component YwqK of YwqJK toxin-antitoxin module